MLACQPTALGTTAPISNGHRIPKAVHKKAKTEGGDLVSIIQPTMILDNAIGLHGRHSVPTALEYKLQCVSRDRRMWATKFIACRP